MLQRKTFCSTLITTKTQNIYTRTPRITNTFKSTKKFRSVLISIFTSIQFRTSISHTIFTIFKTFPLKISVSSKRTSKRTFKKTFKIFLTQKASTPTVLMTLITKLTCPITYIFSITLNRTKSETMT